MRITDNMVISMTRIQIEQTPGVIHIQTQPAFWQVTQSRRLALNIRQKRAALQIRSGPPRLHIDQTESFATSGLKTPLRLAGDFYNDALMAGLDAISSIVQEGLRFQRIEQGGNPIRDIARSRGVKSRQLSLTSMPSVRPSIRYEPGELSVEWTPHSVSTDWEVIEGQAEFVPQQISVHMDPYPSIDISVVEEERIKNPEEEKKKI